METPDCAWLRGYYWIRVRGCWFVAEFNGTGEFWTTLGGAYQWKDIEKIGSRLDPPEIN